MKISNFAKDIVKFWRKSAISVPQTTFLEDIAEIDETEDFFGAENHQFKINGGALN